MSHKSKRKLVVSLTGGLGNQLFQYAVGLFLGDSQDFLFTSQFGKPRKTHYGMSDIYAFENTQATEINLPALNLNFLWLTRKSVGYLLRSAFAPKFFERLPGFRSAIIFATSVLTSIAMRESRLTWAPCSVGFDPRVSKRLSRRLIIGYFQTYRYASKSDVFTKLMSLEAPDANNWFLHLQDRALTEKPIVLHVRLTDYRNEGFGIPAKSYYLDAINILRRTGILGSIWIFSDEPDSLIDFLPEEILKVSEVMLEPPGTQPALVLQAMRLGAGYVIANSTFSWWGAFLRYDQDAPVCYPDPWFQSGPEIPDLCPPTWHRISAQVPNI